jgi:hypothetical protein
MVLAASRGWEQEKRSAIIVEKKREGFMLNEDLEIVMKD